MDLERILGFKFWFHHLNNVNLGKLCNFSKPKFLHQQNGVIKIPSWWVLVTIEFVNSWKGSFWKWHDSLGEEKLDGAMLTGKPEIWRPGAFSKENTNCCQCQRVLEARTASSVCFMLLFGEPCQLTAVWPLSIQSSHPTHCIEPISCSDGSEHSLVNSSTATLPTTHTHTQSN